MYERAYALLEIKSVDSRVDETVITGTATTPTTDRMGDIVEPLGARFTLPLPLMLNHEHKSIPVGRVEFAQPNAGGIPFRAHLPHVKETGRLKERVDEVIHALRYRLLGAVSIGFQRIEGAVERMKSGGLRFKEWNWVELSLVPIPANTDCTISSVKALDTRATASGHNARAVVLDLSHAPASRPNVSTTGHPMNIQEQIRQLEAKHAALVGSQTQIASKAADDGRTMDEKESAAFDDITPDVKSVLADIERLRGLESSVLPKAMPVAGANPGEAMQARAGAVITSGRSHLPKGTGFVRYAMAIANGRGSISDAMMFARKWKDSTPEVLQALEMKANPGTVTDSDWAAPLVYPAQLAAEFIELLRPATVVGRLNLSRVPFNTRIARQLTGSTIAWVGEAAAKPVGELSFDFVTLGITKVAGIVVITDELARLSTPSAEDTVRRDLVAQASKFIDEQFLDPSITSSAARPASITNGAPSVPASGTDAAALRCDLRDLFGLFTTNNQSVSGSALIMTEVMATSIGMMVNALGQVEFSGMGANGGNLAGLTVITSQNVPADTGSELIVLVKQSDVLLADDGGVTVDASREATLDMAGGNSPTFSLWQKNCVGLKAERFINWQKARPESVAYISGANYGSCST